MHSRTFAFNAEAGTAERLALWGEFVRRHIGELEADTFGDPCFDGRLTVAEHGDLKVFGISVSRHRVVRTPRLARRDDRGLVKIAVQIQGIGCFEQNSRKAILTPGEWILYDASRTYSLTNLDTVRQAAIFLPRDALTALGLDIEHACARRFTRAGHAASSVYDLIVGAHEAVQSGRAPDRDLGERLAHFVQLAVLEGDGINTGAALRNAIKRRVTRYVASNLRDPGLTLNAIASASGCSKRYLHKLFETESETLNSLIWRQRLERARDEIGDPAQRRRTITDIAFSWGFSSSSHFSRLFHAEFGMTPRRFRSAASGLATG